MLAVPPTALARMSDSLSSAAVLPIRRDLIIVGGGPAGLCAALYAGRAMLTTTVLEAGAAGGELLKTETIENYPGVGRILGSDLAERFKAQAVDAGAEVREFTAVESLRRLANGEFETVASDGTVYHSTALLYAAGGTPKKLGLPGDDTYAGRGLSYCVCCDANFFRGMDCAVVGGGNSALEESIYLSRIVRKVYLIHRRDTFSAERIVQEHVFANPKIEIVYDTVVEDALGDDAGLRGLALRNAKSNARRELAVSGLFVLIGFSPNTGLLSGLGHIPHDAGGFIITDTSMQTQIPGLYIAGDLRAQLSRQVTTAVGDATTAVVACAKFVAEQKANHAAAR
jgi:thioredoxin reductase (NADPH)